MITEGDIVSVNNKDSPNEREDSPPDKFGLFLYTNRSKMIDKDSPLKERNTNINSQTNKVQSNHNQIKEIKKIPPKVPKLQLNAIDVVKKAEEKKEAYKSAKRITKYLTPRGHTNVAFQKLGEEDDINPNNFSLDN